MSDVNFYEINRKARDCPAEFAADCDRRYAMLVESAAARLADDADNRRIVLLSGPSGSGKTTTAKLLRLRLALRGVRSHVVSLDDYYRTVDLETHPRDEAGGIDFESPELLDIPLLTSHFAELSEGREILAPKFDFPNQRRDMSRAVPLRLGHNEIVIFEGIHALNPILSGPIGPRARKIYVSARSNVVKDGEIFFKGTWVRLARRLIRDERFRGTPASYTLTLWANVRRGERKYISPYKGSADIIIDSFFPYELCALRPYALKVFEAIPEHCPRREELAGIHERLEAFEELDEAYLAHDALLREFIGGGSIKY
jgi:uridine kinase